MQTERFRSFGNPTIEKIGHVPTGKAVYLSPVPFFPSIMTRRKIRLIRVW